MNCPYCRAANPLDEHRCQRCGRRLDASAYARPAYGRGSAATALKIEPAPEAEDAPAPEPEPSRRAYQPSLFSTRVVSFESYAPETVAPKQKTRSGPVTRTRAKRIVPGQESFSFETVITQTQTLSRPGVEPSIVCDAGVAVPAHRLMASAFDLSMVVIAVALFLLVFHFAGGEVVLNAHTMPLCAGIAAIFYLMYELLWCMAGLDTAGMRWAHLRLLNFDGQAPDREQRMIRVASGCLSLLAAGLGILWALVDEESLTWHDHISNTFPSPY